MVRTKADGGGGSRKVVAAKAPRKFTVPTRTPGGSTGGAGGKGKAAGGGGNAAMARPVPEWQKPISHFFTKVDKSTTETSGSEERLLDKENTTPNVQKPEDIEELSSSDSEDDILQATKKILGKKKRDAFSDSDDDDV